MNKEKEQKYWADFHESMEKLGIGKGDILYIGSDAAAVVVLASRELEFSGRDDQKTFLNHLTDTIKERVGQEGTLLFPVYSWKYWKGVPFD